MKKYFNHIIFLISLILLFCSSCDSQQKEYYSKEENYIKASGRIESVKYNDDNTVLYLELSEVIPYFDDVAFKIVGENISIIQENGSDKLLTEGSIIEFTSADKYFGDGYVFPIVALSVNDTVLLDFEDGFSNFLKWLGRKDRGRFLVLTD